MQLNQKTWLIADMYYPSESKPGTVHSHEAVCVLNPSDRDAHLEIALYFKDREPIALQHCTCPARRTSHVRMDIAKTADGSGVPQDIPYAALVNSDMEIAVQYSRADAHQEALAMMTTMAHPL